MTRRAKGGWLRAGSARVALALLAGIASVGCPAGGGGGAPPARELNVLAAASLGQPLRRLAAEYEAAHPGLRVRLSLASSSALERQIEQGAPCDLFVSAAVAPVERLLGQGLLEPATRTVVARNALVVIVPHDPLGGPAGLEDLQDLTGLERLAVGARGVPVGEYARQALQRAGLAERLRDRLAGYPDEPSVVTAVAEGGAPAGVVYASSLTAHPRRERVRRAFQLDETLHDPIVYPAALGTGAGRDPQARLEAAAFLEWLRSAPARAALREAGFSTDGPE